MKVSPVIEGGAYPAKAAVGESIPIRAQVFREGHDAVNASVVLTNPEGQETRFPMHPTTPAGFAGHDGWGDLGDGRLAFTSTDVLGARARGR